MSVIARCAATPRIWESPNPVIAWISVAAPAATASGTSSSAWCWLMTRSITHLEDDGRTRPARRFTSSSPSPTARRPRCWYTSARASCQAPELNARFFPEGFVVSAMRSYNLTPATGLFALHRIETTVRGVEQRLNGCAVAGIDGSAETHRDPRGVGVPGQPLAHAPHHQARRRLVGLRQHQGKLDPTKARGSVDGPAGKLQHRRQPAQRQAPEQVAVAVVDALQAVHVEEDDGKGPLGALRPLDLPLEGGHELAVVGEPGQRVADRQVKQPRLDPPALGHDGRERQSRDGHDGHERLQQQQRFVLSPLRERTVALEGPPDGEARQEENRGRRLAGPEAERRPQQPRPRQQLPRVMLDRRAQTAT